MSVKVRSPLKRGNSYRYEGFSSGFRIMSVALRGHPEDDGGLTGVAVKWTGFPQGGRSGSAWYPFKTESEFWEHDLFRNAFDSLVENKKLKHEHQ